MDKLIGLSWEERQAFHIIRNAIKRKPEIINALLKDMSYESAVSVLLQVRDENEKLLAVSRVFMEAAAALVKLQRQVAKPPGVSQPLE